MFLHETRELRCRGPVGHAFVPGLRQEQFVSLVVRLLALAGSRLRMSGSEEGAERFTDVQSGLQKRRYPQPQAASIWIQVFLFYYTYELVEYHFHCSSSGSHR